MILRDFFSKALNLFYNNSLLFTHISTTANSFKGSLDNVVELLVLLGCYGVFFSTLIFFKLWPYSRKANNNEMWQLITGWALQNGIFSPSSILGREIPLCQNASETYLMLPDPPKRIQVRLFLYLCPLCSCTGTRSDTILCLEEASDNPSERGVGLPSSQYYQGIPHPQLSLLTHCSEQQLRKMFLKE